VDRHCLRLDSDCRVRNRLPLPQPDAVRVRLSDQAWGMLTVNVTAAYVTRIGLILIAIPFAVGVIIALVRTSTRTNVLRSWRFWTVAAGCAGLVVFALLPIHGNDGDSRGLCSLWHRAPNVCVPALFTKELTLIGLIAGLLVLALALFWRVIPVSRRTTVLAALAVVAVLFTIGIFDFSAWWSYWASGD
jgi:hypothetical protein